MWIYHFLAGSIIVLSVETQTLEIIVKVRPFLLRLICTIAHTVAAPNNAKLEVPGFLVSTESRDARD